MTGGQATYGETWAGVYKWAEHLGELGVGPGSHVATFLPPSIDAAMVWVALGCLGAVEVPVNPELKGSFLEHVLDDAAPVLCLARPEFVDRIRDSRPTLQIRAIERGAWENLDAAGSEPHTLPSPTTSHV